MRRSSVAVSSVIAVTGCGGADPVGRGADEAQVSPAIGAVADDVPDDSTLLGPGVLSTRHYELNAALTPDGETIYFTLSTANRELRSYVILFSEWSDDGWTPPRVAPFSGEHSDADPLVTPDGRRIYFISDRPTPTKPGGRDFDLWYVDRAGSGFSEPVHLGAPINTEGDEYYVSVTDAGTIYFSARRPSGVGGSDLYRAVRDGDGYREPELLPPPINSARPDFDPFVAPDESYLIFASVRDDALGDADLYIAWNRDGVWTTPVNLGPSINSEGLEFCPIVSPDGQWFLYTSEKMRDATDGDYATRISRFDRIDNGLGNLYRVPFASLPGAAGER